jgi:hypothetical protein
MKMQIRDLYKFEVICFRSSVFQIELIYFYEKFLDPAGIALTGTEDYI